jgi:hypothetical protein
MTGLGLSLGNGPVQGRGPRREGNSLTGRRPLDYRSETHMQTIFFAYQRPA